MYSEQDGHTHIWYTVWSYTSIVYSMFIPKCVIQCFIHKYGLQYDDTPVGWLVVLGLTAL